MATTIQNGLLGDLGDLIDVPMAWKYLPAPAKYAIRLGLHAPRGALNAAADMEHAIKNPIETAKAFGNLALGIGEKLQRPLGQIDLAQSMTNAAMMQRPVAPFVARIPKIANIPRGPHEKYPEAISLMLNDRYGSWDNFKSSLRDDPVGVLGDLSIVFPGGGETLAAHVPGILGEVVRGVGAAARAIDPVDAALRASGKILEPTFVHTSGNFLGSPDLSRFLAARHPGELAMVGERGSHTNARGARRNAPEDWKEHMNIWDDSGIGSPLSDKNRTTIENGHSPVVDTEWAEYYPNHRPYMGHVIDMHHILGGDFVIPVPRGLHRDIHQRRLEELNWGDNQLDHLQ